MFVTKIYAINYIASSNESLQTHIINICNKFKKFFRIIAGKLISKQLLFSITK